MAVRVGINGFGRIGRSFTRAILARGEQANVELVAVNARTALPPPLTSDANDHRILAVALSLGREGRDVVVVSASGEEIVGPIARALGATHAMATRMVVEDAGYTAWVREPLIKQKRDIDVIGEAIGVLWVAGAAALVAAAGLAALMSWGVWR